MAGFRGSRLGRILVTCVVSAALLWGAATAGLYALMKKPPERFGAVMAHVPMIAMLILPFEPLWNSARGGNLQIGDAAPDFALPLLDGDHNVRLSEEWKKHPVALIFGSYT